MVSRDILSLFVLGSFLYFVAVEAQDTPFYRNKFCYSNRTTANNNTSFQLDLTTLLSSLSSNATGNTSGFYNTTVRSSDPSSDTFYGLFMCRGDVSSQLCHQCVVDATQRLSSQCSLSDEAVIWYEECMVRYSNISLFSTVDTYPGFYMLNTANISNPESFMRLLSATMNETAEEAARPPPPVGFGDHHQKKFATREAPISRSQSHTFLYCLAQCTPDLSTDDCRKCLRDAIDELFSNWDEKQGGRNLYPSCNIRYELYPFYRSISPSPTPAARALVPETNASQADSRYSQDPFYLSHNCTSNQTMTDDRTFQPNLKALLSYLSSNATIGRKSHKADVGNTVFGLFMCRGDLPSPLCEQCVKNATHRISSKCRSSQEGIIWYSHCSLRYSSRYFFSDADTSPMYSKLNVTSSSSSIPGQNYFASMLSNKLAELATDIGNSFERYVTKSSKLNHVQTLYTLAQCTQDLSSEDCKGCLEDVVGTAIPWSRLGSVGGRVLYPSCNLRFELFQFYRDGDDGGNQALPPNGNGQVSPFPPGDGDPEKRNHRSPIIVSIVVSLVVFVMLFSFCYYLVKRKGTNSRRTMLRENFGPESATLEPLQFDLNVIQAATINFSNENYLGKGGFGEVYKGILSDGRQIAVKKLSRSSKQGVVEFKNEVLLIAKLQHRNLVAFIGFCLEEHEKMLIYEFVPNKSLDYFLFDSKRQKSLDWVERYNIIRGIARGILYLHEHSRLKVIHRDLKPSNILLDENMIPKISDFGMARIVEISQDQGSTNRIVGTYGYMSPEYAMLGQFSEKSDVFSFGVMILEIIAGKKNVSSYEPHRVADSLLNYAWRQWRDQTPSSILDPNIKDDYSKIEVIKCIQIGLLCVQHNPDARPTMLIVVSYLSSHSIEIPTPLEPAFFLDGRMDSKAIVQDSSSTQSANNSSLFSINEVSTSIFLPR